MDSDNDLYKGISDELATKSLDGALWTKAFAETGGDSDKAKALYIRMRFAELKSSAERTGIAPETKYDPSEAAIELRRKIQAKLAVHKRATHYETLGLSPTCSEADIAARIEAVTIASARSGTRLGADTNYAIDRLRDDRARKEYDRKLWDDLCGAAQYGRTEAATSLDVSGGADSIFLQWWQSKKVTAIIGATVLVVFGYLAKGMIESKGTHEVSKEAVGIQREAIKAAESVELGHVQNQKAEIEARTEISREVIDRSAQLQNRALAIDEEAERRRRVELEYQANAGTQQLEMQRVEMEHRMQLQREAQQRSVERARELKEEADRMYWSCVGDQLNRGYSSAQVTNACSRYKR